MFNGRTVRSGESKFAMTHRARNSDTQQQQQQLEERKSMRTTLYIVALSNLLRGKVLYIYLLPSIYKPTLFVQHPIHAFHVPISHSKHYHPFVNHYEFFQSYTKFPVIHQLSSVTTKPHSLHLLSRLRRSLLLLRFLLLRVLLLRVFIVIILSRVGNLVFEDLNELVEHDS
jgi:hypothetical protein